MSAWRRIARDRFPDLKNEIDAASDPAALWVELKREFDRAYAQDDAKLIERIHEYAWWMIDRTHSRELADAAIDGFYRLLLERHWNAESWEERRPALELTQYLGEERLTSLYWDYLHSLLPKHQQREFIQELGIGKPVRR